MYNTVKIGTEFTFRREEFVFGLGALAWNKSGSKKRQAEANGQEITQIRMAEEEMKKWVEGIEGDGKKQLRKGNTKLTSVKVEPGNKKHDSSEYKARKVILQFEDARDKSKQEIWTVNFDLDPNCIELQTEPVPCAFYDRHKEMINALFFNRGTCPPDPRWNVGGGGHISLDLATAFGNNLQCFRNFLVLYAAAVMGDDARYNILKASEDRVNAPFMHETGVLPAFIAAIAKLDPPAPAISTIEQLAREINTKVYTRLGGTINDPNLTPADYPHYQAVNLEHIIGASALTTPPLQQRVELRRFEAQQRVEELLDELQVLFGLLEESRRGGTYSLDSTGTLVHTP